EQEPEQRPEPGVRPAPLARVAGCGIQQERGHEPVEVADADHPPRLRSARWNRTMRKAWIANAANAVGSAHNAICSGSSTMPYSASKPWISSTAPIATNTSSPKNR